MVDIIKVQLSGIVKEDCEHKGKPASSSRRNSAGRNTNHRIVFWDDSNLTWGEGRGSRNFEESAFMWLALTFLGLFGDFGWLSGGY